MHSIPLFVGVVLVVVMCDFTGVKGSERSLSLNDLMHEQPLLVKHRNVLVKRSVFPSQQQNMESEEDGPIKGFFNLFHRIRHGRRYTRYRSIGNKCPEGQKMDRNGNCKKLWQ
ncbi:unnamed protein product [Nezara viridula]|uniref:Neuropeptide n=1 Tax=Nezara viridula TaxID=85310 RepID=A0A9P0HK22_NEZVI|nr:unnamed protein product [Nezara viridula]